MKLSEQPDYSGIDRDHLEAKLWNCYEAYSQLKKSHEQLDDKLASARAIMQKFVAFMDEYYSIRGVIEPLGSDSKEDTLLKETYAEIKEWLDD